MTDFAIGALTVLVLAVLYVIGWKAGKENRG